MSQPPCAGGDLSLVAASLVSAGFHVGTMPINRAPPQPCLTSSAAYIEHIPLTGLSSFFADRGNRIAEPPCQEFQV